MTRGPIADSIIFLCEECIHWDPASRELARAHLRVRDGLGWCDDQAEITLALHLCERFFHTSFAYPQRRKPPPRATYEELRTRAYA
jgi:hypothetical protein